MPPEQHAHGDARACRKPYRLQRQRDLDDVAVGGARAGAVPDEVRFELLASGGGVHGVHLHAARIDHQVVGRLARPVESRLKPTQSSLNTLSRC